MRTKAGQIAAIRADQQFWRHLVAEVGPHRFTDPGPMGEWSFGDMAGHLMGWRSRTIGRLEAAVRGEPEPGPPWPSDLDEEEDVDEVNEWIRAQHAGRAAADLVSEYDASFDRIVRALEALPEARLADPDAFPWAGGPLSEVDFTGHLHEEHMPTLRAWLDG